MKRFTKSLLALLLMIGFSGCTDSNTDIVKNGIMDFDKSITVSQAFDNWKSCKNTKWNELTTDNGKNIVEFTCETQEITEYNNHAKSIYTKVVSLIKEYKVYGDNDKNKEVYAMVLNKVLNISTSKYTVQWIVNKDETFNIKYIELQTVWNDNKKYETKLYSQAFLKAVYNNSPFIQAKELDLFDQELNQMENKYSHYLTQYENELLKNVFKYYDYTKAK